LVSQAVSEKTPKSSTFLSDLLLVVFQDCSDLFISPRDLSPPPTYYCAGTPTPCVAYALDSACTSHGCNWSDNNRFETGCDATVDALCDDEKLVMNVEQAEEDAGITAHADLVI